MERPSAKHLIHAFESGGVKTKKMHVLIVYAHQEPKSFNAALKNVAIETLRDQGHTVEISDLYAMEWNPVATRNDIQGELANPDHFKYMVETAAAYNNNKLADDIRQEQKKLEEADLVIFQFPLHWFSYPAIMKGWFDRVLTYGFAYGKDGKFYDESPFKGKRAILSFTTGTPETAYTPAGMNGDMEVIVWPLQFGILRFCGFDVMAPNICYAPAHMEQSDRVEFLQKWADRLRQLTQEKPLTFIPFANINMQAGMVLSEDYLESKPAMGQVAPTVGQHLGKRFPVGSLIPGRANPSK